jgi:hypothetical protein
MQDQSSRATASLLRLTVRIGGCAGTPFAKRYKSVCQRPKGGNVTSFKKGGPPGPGRPPSPSKHTLIMKDALLLAAQNRWWWRSRRPPQLSGQAGCGQSIGIHDHAQ